MAGKRKETPEKYCLYCNKKLERKRLPNGDLEYLKHFNARKYCDQQCMADMFRGRKKTSDPSWYTAHERARRIKVADKCEICGSTQNVDVHHIDCDWKNNEINNLQAVCRSCHNKIHQAYGVCKICGKRQTAFGLCNKHYLRFKKYGDPLYTKIKVAEI